MTLPVILLGGGGHAKVLLSVLKVAKLPVIGILDNNPGIIGKQVLGVSVLGTEELLCTYLPDQVRLVNAVGSVSQPVSRMNVYNKFKLLGYSFEKIIHPSSIVAEDVILGEGVQIMAGSIIQPGSRIADNTILNTHVTVDHDCRIGKHVHLSPGVTLAGGVEIGNCSHIGAGATVIQEVVIGDSCLIGAGSMVNKSIPDNAVAYGVPAKVKL